MKYTEKKKDVYHKTKIFQEKMKNTFDRRIKEDDFKINDLVLKWDVRIEDKRKVGKVLIR